MTENIPRLLFFLSLLQYKDVPLSIAYNHLWPPSRQKTSTQCWFNVEPPPTPVAQHQINIGLTPCHAKPKGSICWLDKYKQIRWCLLALLSSIQANTIPVYCFNVRVNGCPPSPTRASADPTLVQYLVFVETDFAPVTRPYKWKRWPNIASDGPHLRWFLVTVFNQSINQLINHFEPHGTNVSVMLVQGRKRWASIDSMHLYWDAHQFSILVLSYHGPTEQTTSLTLIQHSQQRRVPSGAGPAVYNTIEARCIIH